MHFPPLGPMIDNFHAAIRGSRRYQTRRNAQPAEWGRFGSDPMRRPLHTKAMERTRRQRGHAHNVAQSQALEARCAAFRSAKAAREAG